MSTSNADMAEIQWQIDTLIRLIERLNKRKAEHDRLRRVLPTIEPPESPQQCAERIEKWWSKNAQRLIDDIKAKLDALYPEIQAYWSDRWSWDSFCMMLIDGKDNYEKWKASDWPDIHIQALRAVSDALASDNETGAGPGQAGETARRISREEANVEVRRLLKETPSWDWTVRRLAQRVGCSTGLISRCPAWQAYNDMRARRRKERTINTVSISEEMEAVLGTGERDEVVQQLIGEQEEDQREDTRQAKLYVSHEKKPRGRES